jgi:ABC-2 type transport system permease protein
MQGARVVAVFKRELGEMFASPVGAVFIVFYLLISNGFFFFIRDFFGAGQASLRDYFAVLPWMFLFFIPALTMRLWAEEKKAGTLELLLTLPLREGEAVLGKFLAAETFLAITLAFTFTLPLTVGLLGDPDTGVIVASYVGALLLGAAYIAVGLWVSALTDSQVTAFVGTLALLLVLLLAGVVPQWLGSTGWPVAVFGYLSLLTHFEGIARGVLDSRDVVYYALVILLFLHLGARHLEARKWR